MLLEHELMSLYSGGFIRTLCIMADECNDVTTIEELTICCRWVESVYQNNTSLKFYP